ncbi:MAG: Gfo/Idh/MocA family oxidoreductase [Phycisphaerae bacterium]|nr:Gfo/Idh/MocA family oxidoreductase [Phycisphaerae bacterium]
MDQKRSLSRRDLLAKSALGLAAAGLGGCAAADKMGAAQAHDVSKAKTRRKIGPNDTINIGVIGTGGIAVAHRGALKRIAAEDKIKITAVCDCYETRMQQYADAVQKEFGNRPETIKDYRALLDRKDVDKVLIATPEHWHGRQTIDACLAGKYIYCEKPMTHHIEEANEVLDVINKTGNIVQIGIQGMSDDSYRAARDYIKNKGIGQIVHAQTSYVRRYSDDKGNFERTLGLWRTGHKSNEPKPNDLDWNMWLGPAAKVPWDARKYWDWRNYFDYSGGIATDLFVHRISRMMVALDLMDPVCGVGMGGIFCWPDGRDVPDNFEMILEYPKNDLIEKGMTIHVLGTMANHRDIEHCIRGFGATLIFDKNQGFSVWDQNEKGPDWKTNKSKPIYVHKRTGAEDQSLHHKNHHAAIRANDKKLLNCPPELGWSAVVAVNLANEGYRQRKCMVWDAKKRQMRAG